MFGLFKKKSKIDLLKEKYQKLQQESYKLSTVNRMESDKKLAEAEEVYQEIKALETKEN
ncbi:Lacal_2735 family protein [Algoriphagus lutimaris]|uniref:Lacal_2735 family protein n=1 Tax=Algoriphagus lutimaris TaxID=613197 RepID=UPI00196AF3A1|nr:Lacal_2735 family protein [Algoriphagus lutimaris]MBN3519426.1 Lacal_2735 family protein [Algoriphagus lutimaris]